MYFMHKLKTIKMFIYDKSILLLLLKQKQYLGYLVIDNSDK